MCLFLKKVNNTSKLRLFLTTYDYTNYGYKRNHIMFIVSSQNKYCTGYTYLECT